MEKNFSREKSCEECRKLYGGYDVEAAGRCITLPGEVRHAARPARPVEATAGRIAEPESGGRRLIMAFGGQSAGAADQLDRTTRGE